MRQQILFDSNTEAVRGALSFRRKPPRIPSSGEAAAPVLRVEPYAWPFLAEPQPSAVALLEESRVRGGRQWTLGGLGDPYGSERSAAGTRRLLESWQREWGKSIWLITRSATVVQDLHLLRSLSVRHRLLVSLMLSTLDGVLADRLEPDSPSPQARLQALGRLSRSGIATGGLLMPILPGVNDSFVALEELMSALVEAGIGHLNVAGVRLQQPGQREACLGFLEELGPGVAALARRVLAAGSEPSPDYQRILATRVRVLRQKFGLAADSPLQAREQLWLPHGGAFVAA